MSLTSSRSVAEDIIIVVINLRLDEHLISNKFSIISSKFIFTIVLSNYLGKSLIINIRYVSLRSQLAQQIIKMIQILHILVSDILCGCFIKTSTKVLSTDFEVTFWYVRR